MVASRIRSQVMSGYERMTSAQMQLSSGKKVQRPSDDPVAMVAVLSIRREQALMRRLERSAEDSKGMLAASDTALQASSDLVWSAVSRVNEFFNGGMNQSTARDALAVDVEGLKSELLAVANTTSGGRPLFAGTAAPASVFNSSGVYQGNSAPPLRDIASGVTIPVGFAGNQVFGDGPSSVFSALEDLASAIRSNNGSGVTAARTRLETAVDRIAVATVEVGSRSRLVDEVGARNTEASFRLDADLSRLSDAEFEESVIEFTSSRMAYEATLATSAKIFQTSLIDFLR